MKNLNSDEFTIIKSTMRELTHSEVEIVGGGSSILCVIRATSRLSRLTAIPETTGDVIFDDGFDEQP